LRLTLAAVTSLALGDWFTFYDHHVLPPNLLELSGGDIFSSACLLPLKHLRELSLANIEGAVPDAEDLLQLTSLTALTAVDLSYGADADRIDESAGGWGALQLRHLGLWPSSFRGSSLARETMLQLTSLTRIESLCIANCGLGALEPQQLGVALAGMRYLSSLTLCDVHWGTSADAAADAAALLG
jgi:hypothetical protein